MGTDENLKLLPLDDMHRAAGARFGGFAGWSMPITYPLGVMKEHLHTREKAGLFDISHMKLFDVSGSGAGDLLSHACPLGAGSLQHGQSKYTFFLNEQAGILDDLIVTRLGEEHFIVVANAGNAAGDEAHLRNLAKNFDCKIDALDHAFLAIQGPQAADVVRDAGIAGTELAFMNGFAPKPGWFMSRSGYTGEDGFEIGLPSGEARELATRLLADERVAWIGLAARDSLRLEAGLCLHGQDINPDIDPVDAGLAWAISKPVREKAVFIGARALLDKIAAGPGRKRVGLKPDGRQPVRSDSVLVDVDGNSIGLVTSGGFGPSAGHPVAMGYVGKHFAAVGTLIFAEVRGNRIQMHIHPLPFTPHRYHKG
ncbi:glycine cleavage system aminomethyltransferase GcvT [Phyllobacterium endophyticum]|uniref:aminomethyltransferase n=1 Tax=Phyllobacterium endophyticum TaxID=1149773 RepID=A0A2P7AMV3_9HYPH|nr:glycine cleavage system aminomethyltransferase GcvT [Phyllobacterium endophyticum]MBB3238244.1 aminomethyltransferase [Phyllobacterium endophyticum]PSH55511.1 glycine cleavage system aminomethyltransferase T [Phyllobacterium endophyticum]TYR40248.1 glycine cleavage system aminomethyltransferase GcvT [Phyllobacterium endophyticum]